MINRGTNLLGDIRKHFGSLAHLQSTFSAAALGMINSGWVWLVSDEYGNMEVVATFGAGTLLVRSRTHMRTAENPILGESIYSRYRGPTVKPKKKGRSEKNSAAKYSSEPGGYVSTPSSTLSSNILNPFPNIYDDKPYTPTAQAEHDDKGVDQIGDILTPLLCVSVQEHAWVGSGYGVWGKEEYLKQFWTVVDWERVANSLDKAQQLA